MMRFTTGKLPLILLFLAGYLIAAGNTAVVLAVEPAAPPAQETAAAPAAAFCIHTMFISANNS